MKKILIVLIITALLSGLVFGYQFKMDSFDFEDFKLYKGWNLIPNIGSSATTITCDGSPNWIYNYFWDPIKQEYSTKGYSNPVWPQEYDNVYSTTSQTTAQWVYLRSNCTANGKISYWSANSDYTNVLNDLKLVEGWNMVLVNPKMEGKLTKEVFANCEITKANVWDPKTQLWAYDSESYSSSYFAELLSNSDMRIRNDDELGIPHVGQVLVMKLNDTCTLNYPVEKEKITFCSTSDLANTNGISIIDYYTSNKTVDIGALGSDEITRTTESQINLTIRNDTGKTIRLRGGGALSGENASTTGMSSTTLPPGSVFDLPIYLGEGQCLNGDEEIVGDLIIQYDFESDEIIKEEFPCYIKSLCVSQGGPPSTS
jgi:hypothetical protein